MTFNKEKDWEEVSCVHSNFWHYTAVYGITERFLVFFKVKFQLDNTDSLINHIVDTLVLLTTLFQIIITPGGRSHSICY